MQITVPTELNPAIFEPLIDREWYTIIDGKLILRSSSGKQLRTIYKEGDFTRNGDKVTFSIHVDLIDKVEIEEDVAHYVYFTFDVLISEATLIVDGHSSPLSAFDWVVTPTYDGDERPNHLQLYSDENDYFECSPYWYELHFTTEGLDVITESLTVHKKQLVHFPIEYDKTKLMIGKLTVS